MKNAACFIILVTYYLFAAMMLDIISGHGFLHAAMFFLVSLILISVITLAFRKITGSEQSLWDFSKRLIPPLMGIELISLFFFRMYILSLI